jgi:hypothetical protein
MPSRLVAILGALRLVKLPPTVVLVRNIPDAVLSYFFKWREAKALGPLDDYVAREPSPKGVDLWWFIRFFNRWGLLQRVFPDAVLVVRYEDLQAEPEVWVRRIWAHWGIELSRPDLDAAMSVYSREEIAAHLDPAYGEDITPDRRARQALRLEWNQAALLGGRLVEHLEHDFGYVTLVRHRRAQAAAQRQAAA